MHYSFTLAQCTNLHTAGARDQACCTLAQQWMVILVQPWFLGRCSETPLRSRVSAGVCNTCSFYLHVAAHFLYWHGPSFVYICSSLGSPFRPACAEGFSWQEQHYWLWRRETERVWEKGRNDPVVAGELGHSILQTGLTPGRKPVARLWTASKMRSPGSDLQSQQQLSAVFSSRCSYCSAARYTVTVHLLSWIYWCSGKRLQDLRKTSKCLRLVL